MVSKSPSNAALRSSFSFFFEVIETTLATCNKCGEPPPQPRCSARRRSRSSGQRALTRSLACFASRPRADARRTRRSHKAHSGSSLSSSSLRGDDLHTVDTTEQVPGVGGGAPRCYMYCCVSGCADPTSALSRERDRLPRRK